MSQLFEITGILQKVLQEAKKRVSKYETRNLENYLNLLFFVCLTKEYENKSYIN